jgi:hypothetical protein
LGSFETKKNHRLSPYGCVATGDEVGMIEVVLNAQTTANITKKAGGASAGKSKSSIVNRQKTKNNDTHTHTHTHFKTTKQRSNRIHWINGCAISIRRLPNIR